jgi:excisionase family DNA binding protein
VSEPKTAADYPADDYGVPAWLTVPEVAQRLGVEVTRVRQLLREGKLIAVRRDAGQPLLIPADFVSAAGVLKGLAGTLTLLHDAGHSPTGALRWLYEPDGSLPGTPVQALVENRGTEVKRRAQALAF